MCVETIQSVVKINQNQKFPLISFWLQDGAFWKQEERALIFSKRLTFEMTHPGLWIIILKQNIFSHRLPSPPNQTPIVYRNGVLWQQQLFAPVKWVGKAFARSTFINKYFMKLYITASKWYHLDTKAVGRTAGYLRQIWFPGRFWGPSNLFQWEPTRGCRSVIIRGRFRLYGPPSCLCRRSR